MNFTGCCYDTVSKYIKKCQEIIYSDIENEDPITGGPGIEVQIDESKFGKRKS
jgi:hypothetical protein